MIWELVDGPKEQTLYTQEKHLEEERYFDSKFEGTVIKVDTS